MRSSIRSTLQQWLDLAIEPRHLEVALDHGIRALQREAGVEIDGVLGPLTSAHVDARLEAQAADQIRLPRGKGVFVRSLAAAGTPKAVLARMQACGLRWIAVQRIWQYEGARPTRIYNARSILGLADAIHGAGHQLWLWGFPATGKHVEFAADLVAAAVLARADGIIIDPEKPFIGRASEAQALMDTVVACARVCGLPLGVTSYGSPDNFPSFPWRVFAAADFGMPQIYDAKHTQGPDYPKHAVERWSELGFRAIVPATAGFNRTASEMADLLSQTPVPARAIAWWDWWNLSRRAGRWQAVAQYQGTVTPP